MPDYREVARILVERQLRIQAGECVRLSGGIHTLPFLEEIAVKVRQKGAFPMLSMTWESLGRRLVNEIPDLYLERTAKHSVPMEELTDCRISLPPLPDPRASARLDPKKLRCLSRAGEPVHDASVRKGYRRIGIGFPTREEAEIYDLPFEEYHHRFWSAVEADLSRIAGLCEKLRARLAGAEEVTVTGPEGARLTFSIKGRRINMDDGVISEKDLESGDVTANLPFGEVYLAPVEETVDGVAVFPRVFHQGKRIERLRLVFRKGHLVDSSAASNHDLFLEVLDTHVGDKERIGELGIGTNHNVHVPLGNVLLDEKIFGSVHLAIGENRGYGGKNNSSCHWDMVMLSPTLLVDGRPLLDEGEFRV